MIVYHLINKATGDDCALLFHSKKQALFELSKLKESPFYKDITIAQAYDFGSHNTLEFELNFLEEELSVDENS